jgi:taurine dioxygenase
MSNTISWKPLSPFGAVLDLDLSKELTAAQAADFLQLFRQHYLLVLRGQNLDEAQQKKVMSYLGPVPSDAVGLTSNDPNVGLQGSIQLAYHSDLSFAAEPDLGASLFAVDLVNDASSTSFASGTRAYASLPEALKERLRGLKALNIWSIDQTGRNHVSSLKDSDPRSTHPVVWEHPATGERVLYVTEMQTDSIIGLPAAESEALIKELFGYLYAPDNIVEHRWRVGDLAIWDNRALQHARKDVSQVGIRTLRRVSIARRSFFDQFPQFRPGESGFVDERMKAMN